MKRIGMLLIILLLGQGMRVQAVEKVDVPKEVKEISEELGEHYGICPEIIQAMAYQESRFDPNAVNGDCIGIMQVSEKWHKERMERLGVTNLMDTEQNMTVAVDYLSELVDQYGEIEVVLMKYNGDSRAGTGEISDYADHIMMLSASLERQHEK